MNEARLLELGRVLRDDPRRFNMEIWKYEYGENLPVSAYVNEELLRTNVPECGTVGCLAGTAVALWGDSIPATAHNNRWMREGSKVLGLTELQAETLFYACEWPRHFYHAYNEAKERLDPAGMVQVAIDRITHFIYTDGRE